MSSNLKNGAQKLCNIHYPAVSDINMYAAYFEIYSNDPCNTNYSHVHAECEIYINLTGNVSFMVENSIYPVLSGNIIIARPYEYHHCIYHSNDLHKFFHILFSSGQNEKLFDRFYNRDIGKNNLLILSPENKDEVISLCHKIIDAPGSDAENYFHFFKLIHLLNGAETVDAPAAKFVDFQVALNYINRNFSFPMTVRDAADAAHVSLNTLERHFYEAMRISPYTYLQKKRLANAAELLSKGSSVTDACVNSGFCDCSSFIALFKKNYGTTPLKYKKQLKF